MSTPNESGTPSKRARNDEAQTPNRNPITPSRRARSVSQQTPSRTPNRNRMFNLGINLIILYLIQLNNFEIVYHMTNIQMRKVKRSKHR